MVGNEEQLNTFRHGNTDLCTKIHVFLDVFIWLTEGWSNEARSRGPWSHSQTLQSLVLLSSPYAASNSTNLFVATFLTIRHFKQTGWKVRLKVEFQSLLCVICSQRKRKQNSLLWQMNPGRNLYQALQGTPISPLRLQSHCDISRILFLNTLGIRKIPTTNTDQQIWYQVSSW
jgi:hypothetical protein